MADRAKQEIGGRRANGVEDLGFTLSRDVQAEMLRQGQLPAQEEEAQAVTKENRSDSTQVVPQITTKQLLARMQSYAEAQFADPARNKQELIVPLQRFLRLAYELSVPDAERSDAALAAFPESARGQELRKLYRGIVKAEFGYECLLNTESVSSRFMRISPALEALRRCEFETAKSDLGTAQMYLDSEALHGGAGPYELEAQKLLPEIIKRVDCIYEILREALHEQRRGVMYSINPALQGMATALTRR